MVLDKLNYEFKNKGLSIDYTSVVVGYLKSVEQLLYMLYISAFEGSAGIKYWDRCNRVENFDVSKSEYRYEPYSLEKQWKRGNQQSTGTKVSAVCEGGPSFLQVL